ncbi:hypothetical protein VL20_2190 [Microcystis panniformis FACHB-1757]|uniref:Uncharacterized protein n=1 Tax=Microcystis panniformis FACHB-1757 TaxID=1638788 RepID=A0A0K1RZH1_9CHRO|nr:hypothetical protein VL20_2190 [Microcystis panniformis FACHB-1757]
MGILAQGHPKRTGFSTQISDQLQKQSAVSIHQSDVSLLITDY